MIHFNNEPKVVPGSRILGESYARVPCRRCGIDLPKSRFKADGSGIIKQGQVRNKYPYHCADCVPYAKEEDEEQVAMA